MVHINSATPPKGRRFTFPGIKNSWMLMADGKWEYVQRKPGRGQIQIKPNTSEPSDWYVRLDYNRLEFRSIIVPMIKQATNQSMIEVFDVKQWKYRYLIGREVNRFLDFPFKFIKDGRVMKLRIGKERIGQLRIKNMRHWEVAHCISEHVSQATDATSMFYIKELLIGTHKKNNKVQMKLGLAEYDLINGLELSESDLLTSICKLNTKQKAQTLVRHPMLDIKSDEVFAEFWRSRKDLRNSNSKEDLDCDTDNKLSKECIESAEWDKELEEYYLWANYQFHIVSHFLKPSNV
eukprot:706366_1